MPLAFRNIIVYSKNTNTISAGYREAPPALHLLSSQSTPHTCRFRLHHRFIITVLRRFFKRRGALDVYLYIRILLWKPLAISVKGSCKRVFLLESHEANHKRFQFDNHCAAKQITLRYPLMRKPLRSSFAFDYALRGSIA